MSNLLGLLVGWRYVVSSQSHTVWVPLMVAHCWQEEAALRMAKSRVKRREKSLQLDTRLKGRESKKVYPIWNTYHRRKILNGTTWASAALGISLITRFLHVDWPLVVELDGDVCDGIILLTVDLGEKRNIQGLPVTGQPLLATYSSLPFLPLLSSRSTLATKDLLVRIAYHAFGDYVDLLPSKGIPMSREELTAEVT
ncbi:hypothetical protein ARMGADRAFT_1068856 [Armillaria gallica]|uniref:Uncharacterized protein n=1 Tax=Armillaria gallica TaxID=47427 RepID=A0A2H3CCC8_ARMGA|nr:hypothetical protein ARMGADRAFT_1068856 [Armillaria gallica]